MTFLHSLDWLKATGYCYIYSSRQHFPSAQESFVMALVSHAGFWVIFFKLVTKLALCHQILPQRFDFNVSNEWMTICCKLRPVTCFVRPMMISIYLSKMCHGWRKYWHTCTPISFERFDKLRGEMAICNGEIGPQSNQKEVLYLSARHKIHYNVQVNDITK